MCSYSVRLFRHDLLTRGSMIISSMPGLWPVCGITILLTLLFRFPHFVCKWMHFKSMEQFCIIPAYLESAFGTQRNYSIDFTGLSTIFGLLMRTMDIHKNRYTQKCAYILLYMTFTCNTDFLPEDVVQIPLLGFPREALFHKEDYPSHLLNWECRIAQYKLKNWQSLKAMIYVHFQPVWKKCTLNSFFYRKSKALASREICIQEMLIKIL